MADKKRKVGFWVLVTTKPKKTPELERFEQKSELPMLVLAVLMLVGILLPMFYAIPERWLFPLEVFDWFIWAVFFLEFAIRIKLAPEKLHYAVFNWLDIVIIVLPAIRVIRIFRALRILRSLRLLRVFSVGYKRAGSLKTLSRRSRLDFIIVATVVLMKPIALGTIVVLLSFLIKENSVSPLFINLADKGLRLTGLLFGAYFLNRVFIKEILIFSIRKSAEKSESNYDQILIPTIERLAPIIIGVLTGFFSLQFLGLNTSALSVMIGGLSFILAFALQEALSNIFSGLFLTIETPFKFGEIIKLADLGICEVRRVGIRATELYLIEDNTIVSIPNREMAGKTIINLSRPLPDLLLNLPLGVAYGTDIQKCRGIVLLIMNSNPYVVGKPLEKIKSLQAALKDNPAFIEKEMLAWGVDYWKAREKFERAYRDFIYTLKAAEGILYQFKGDQQLDDKEKLTVRSLVIKIEEVFEKTQTEFLLLFTVSKKDPSLTRPHPIPDFLNIEQTSKRLLDLRTLEEYNLDHLNDRYLNKLKIFKERTERLIEEMEDLREEDELRLDVYIKQLIEWLEDKFQNSSNTHEYPELMVEEFDDSSVNLRAEYYVFGIDMERYERIERVEAELKEKILSGFEKNQIEIPFPQREVRLKQ